MRIFIFGHSGSGKSTAAYFLSEKLNIPVFELDDVMFIEKFSKMRDKAERKKMVSKLASRKNWIIEGSQTSSWTNPAIEKADYFIHIKTSRFKAVYRVTKRWVKRKIHRTHDETFMGLIDLYKYIFALNDPNGKYAKEQWERMEKFNGRRLAVHSKKDINHIVEHLKKAN